jgi:hypothetical protein
MKNKIYTAAVMVLVVVTMLSGAEAKSKASPVVEANIPFAFQVGSRTLPAGSYKFELATGVPQDGDSTSVLIVRSLDLHVYQALAVPVNVGAGLANESRAVFDGSEQHSLVAVWQSGNRLDVQPATLETAQSVDEWSGDVQLVSVASVPRQ